MIRNLIAYPTSPAAVRIFSLAQMLFLWNSTVFGDNPSRSAICVVVSPSQIPANTMCWRGVNGFFFGIKDADVPSVGVTGVCPFSVNVSQKLDLPWQGDVTGVSRIFNK
jgi:hypothetical protein